jgi:two-component system, chemotaxis family, protein-glutamate methylesterase/glutaminase
MPGHDIVVVGASAGGVETLIKLVEKLPADLPASVFVVLHIPAQNPSLMPEILSRSGQLKAVHPMDDEAIQQRCIYVAPPDLHLLVERGRVHLLRGPKENRHRPAIDPLFRSAAAAYGPRVVGVVLTGSLDDGTAGLLAIKRLGGVAIVQDPVDALYPSMPLHALEHVDVDYKLPVSEIGPLITRLAYEPLDREGAYHVPEEKLQDAVQRAEMIRSVLFKDKTLPTTDMAAQA